MAMPMQSKNTLNRSAEVMNEGLDTPIKIEIKNEEEEPTGKSHGFICPKCEAHFLYESYFIEHIETHHEDIKVSEDLDCYTNKPAHPSKSLEEVSNPQKTLASAKTVFKCDECVTSAYVLSFLDSMRQRTCFLEHWRTRTDSCCKGEAMIKVVARKSLKTVD